MFIEYRVETVVFDLVELRMRVTKIILPCTITSLGTNFIVYLKMITH